uniref:R3H domain-containing protein n=1 Tax=Chromera velia CCMP2878 TaxID=1169474 RepID=A0A0G4IBL7_9ALVE|eukprot:Cvel_12779.t1-p1 / transcript=Cvel_12779.t1 / gene=Cvel_12779 / organism=Chromera_velia_CCMP2878 / gene_product=hypothetical protein / transcript_product=hypothetical protein / location=Cvel_scaffold850:35558-38267(-) / protein_length=808 / sequence_SO=supercontig / SO=protein_coding / is_pseudo=false
MRMPPMKPRYRQIVHAVAKRFRLQTSSHGWGDDRFTVISTTPDSREPVLSLEHFLCGVPPPELLPRLPPTTPPRPRQAPRAAHESEMNTETEKQTGDCAETARKSDQAHSPSPEMNRKDGDGIASFTPPPPLQEHRPTPLTLSSCPPTPQTDSSGRVRRGRGFFQGRSSVGGRSLYSDGPARSPAPSPIDSSHTAQPPSPDRGLQQTPSPMHPWDSSSSSRKKIESAPSGGDGRKRSSVDESLFGDVEISLCFDYSRYAPDPPAAFRRSAPRGREDFGIHELRQGVWRTRPHWTLGREGGGSGGVAFKLEIPAGSLEVGVEEEGEGEWGLQCALYRDGEILEWLSGRRGQEGPSGDAVVLDFRFRMGGEGAGECLGLFRWCPAKGLRGLFERPPFEFRGSAGRDERGDRIWRFHIWVALFRLMDCDDPSMCLGVGNGSRFPDFPIFTGTFSATPERAFSSFAFRVSGDGGAGGGKGREGGKSLVSLLEVSPFGGIRGSLPFPSRGHVLELLVSPSDQEGEKEKEKKGMGIACTSVSVGREVMSRLGQTIPESENGSSEGFDGCSAVETVLGFLCDPTDLLSVNEKEGEGDEEMLWGGAAEQPDCPEGKEGHAESGARGQGPLDILGIRSIKSLRLPTHVPRERAEEKVHGRSREGASEETARKTAESVSRRSEGSSPIGSGEGPLGCWLLVCDSSDSATRLLSRVRTHQSQLPPLDKGGPGGSSSEEGESSQSERLGMRFVSTSECPGNGCWGSPNRDLSGALVDVAGAFRAETATELGLSEFVEVTARRRPSMNRTGVGRFIRQSLR